MQEQTNLQQQLNELLSQQTEVLQEVKQICDKKEQLALGLDLSVLAVLQAEGIVSARTAELLDTSKYYFVFV